MARLVKTFTVKSTRRNSDSGGRLFIPALKIVIGGAILDHQRRPYRVCGHLIICTTSMDVTGKAHMDGQSATKPGGTVSPEDREFAFEERILIYIYVSARRLVTRSELRIHPGYIQDTSKGYI